MSRPDAKADANGWMPIWLAPKGYLLLLFCPDGADRVMTTGEYDRDRQCWVSVPGRWTRNPTHWQHLPNWQHLPKFPAPPVSEGDE